MPKRKRKGKSHKPVHLPDRVRHARAYRGGFTTWMEDYGRGSNSSVRLHPVVHLDDGEIGYGMDPYRLDDCFQAAIATATQIPIKQVPDLRLDKRVAAGEDPDEINEDGWEKILRWLDARGLELVLHDEVPVEEDRWIGVVLDPNPEGPFGDHSLVMSHARLVFDPGVTVKPPPGKRYMRFPPSAIAYGISFDRKEDQ